MNILILVFNYKLLRIEFLFAIGILIMNILILVFNYKLLSCDLCKYVIILKQIYIILHTFDSGMIGGVNYYMLTVKLMV